ncbi:rac GTPase-activating protein 1-like isoform X2 [Leptopilina boulardi]|uniref:rac GTPase-activating protein 1-like isoform X2 n=1 Tax=Leptopilina boulardi TaxID=63433 RepID=UPI0021F60054|nr:rac GTPase-activating protein 1-like isoform X2 [Leptopilina boulardi]
MFSIFEKMTSAKNVFLLSLAIFALVNDGLGMIEIHKKLRRDDAPSYNLDSIEDYAFKHSPFVPSIVVKCIQELENRGMHQMNFCTTKKVGVEEINDLLNTLITKNTNVDISSYSISVIAGTLTYFLRNIKETLISSKSVYYFAKAVELETDNKELMQLIKRQPTIKRNTLALIIIHLKRHAQINNYDLSEKSHIKHVREVLFKLKLYKQIQNYEYYEILTSINKITLRLLKLSKKFWNSIVDYTSIIDVMPSVIEANDEDDWVASGGRSSE